MEPAPQWIPAVWSSALEPQVNAEAPHWSTAMEPKVVSTLEPPPLELDSRTFIVAPRWSPTAEHHNGTEHWCQHWSRTQEAHSGAPHGDLALGPHCTQGNLTLQARTGILLWSPTLEHRGVQREVWIMWELCHPLPLQGKITTVTNTADCRV